MPEEKGIFNGIKIYIKYDNIENVNWDDIKDNPEKIPFIIQHGHTANHFFLKPIYDYFKKKGFPVVSFDWRGHGWSQKGLSGKYKLDYCVEDLFGVYNDFLKKRFGYKKFHFLGHSMGGFIALKYALKYPETLSKLILLSTATCPVNNFILKILLSIYILYWKMFYKRVFQKKKESHIKLGIENFPHWKDQTLMPDKKASIEFLKDMKNYCVVKNLKSIKIPTLVCIGSLDSGKFINQSKMMAKSIPNAEFLLMEGYEHNIAIHAKEKVAEKLYEFLIK
ncbi:MAG: alpha/beta fold hydrolase [Promethearchaeota archaeon]